MGVGITPQIVDVSGRPMVSATAHVAASRMNEFNPSLRSADADLIPELKTIQARANDLQRNYSLVSGGARIHTDNIVGPRFRLSAKPNYRALGMDFEWASEWARDVEAKFAFWAEDESCFIDAARHSTFTRLITAGYLQYLSSGAIFGVAEWVKRVGTPYRTAINLVDVARLSNPHNLADSKNLRGGIESGKFGQAIAYHIRSALDSDRRYGADTYTWNRVTKYTRHGRTKVFHIFDKERAGQSHGLSKLATIIASAFKLGKFQDVSLEAATLNNMYAAVLESEYSYAAAAELLGADKAGEVAADLVNNQADYYKDRTVDVGGARVLHTFPGEKFKFANNEHPGPNFAEFEKSFLRKQAGGQNLSYELYSRDYSDTNYAGAMAGLEQVWKHFDVQKTAVCGRLGRIIYSLWLEESIDKGVVEIPRGAPDFYTGKSAYTACSFIGAGRVSVDPLKQAKSDELELDMGVGTLEDSAARRGRDYEEVMDQLKREKEMLKDRGLERGDVRGFMASDNGVA